MMSFSETFQRRALTICLWAAGLLAVLVITLIGVEYDEMWIIASARGGFDAEVLPDIRSVMTSGGLHFYLVGLTHWLPVHPLLVPRALSLISAIVLFYVILRQLAPWIQNGVEQRIVLVTCLAAPGTILMAGMGYGVMMATLLFLAGMSVALKSERISPSSAILAGVLIGAALATRWTLIPALPAILLWACYSRGHLWHNILMSVLGGVIAVAVFAAFVGVQASILSGGDDGVSIIASLRASGASDDELKSPARLYAFLIRLVTTLPMAMIVLAGVAYVSLRQEQQSKRLITVLLGAAVLIAAAWILRSPWMHLRYIWPVYFMVALCAGLGLAALYRTSQKLQRPELGLLAVGLPLAMAVAQMLIAVRLIAIGAGMQVNAAGYEDMENGFKPFQHIQEQREITRALQALDPEAVVGTIRMPFEYGVKELEFLSGREVIDYARADDRQLGMHPDYFLVHRFSPLNQTGYAWLETLGAPVQVIRGYTLYDVPQAVELPDPVTVVLDPQLYRFTLPNRLSLTWY